MSLPRKRILVVDDEEDLALLIKSRLEANRFSVVIAADGDEGLNQIKKEKPDLIILDIGMARIDGYSFVLELKREFGSHAIPIIVLTARDKMQDLFLMEGVQDYLLKPFHPEDLLARIRNLLRKQKNLSKKLPDVRLKNKEVPHE